MRNYFSGPSEVLKKEVEIVMNKNKEEKEDDLMLFAKLVHKAKSEEKKKKESKNIVEFKKK